MLQKIIFTQKNFKNTKINGIEKHGFGVHLRQNHPNVRENQVSLIVTEWQPRQLVESDSDNQVIW